MPLTAMANAAFYILTLSAGYICLLMGGVWMSRLLKNNLKMCIRDRLKVDHVPRGGRLRPSVQN